MKHSRRALGALVLAALVTGGLSACATDAAVEATPSHDMHDQHTTVNGEVPLGTPRVLLTSTRLIDETTAGIRHLVYRDVRAVGTRAAIHMHPYGGSTCVLTGEVTIYIEGKEPLTAGPGDCYWMPIDTPMYAYNSGTVDAVFFDTFNIPPGTEPWVVIEPGMEDEAINFG